MSATQRPINSTIYGTPGPDPAWKTIPSCFLVTTKDNAINPDLQRFQANRMNAIIAEVAGSHATLVAHLEEVVDLILEASQIIGRHEALAPAI